MDKEIPIQTIDPKDFIDSSMPVNNRIRCTFPTRQELNKSMDMRTYQKCNHDLFSVYFNRQTNMVTIRCSRNPKHLLTEYQLTQMEVKEDGHLKQLNPDGSDYNDDNPNNNGLVTAPGSQETNQGTRNNEPSNKPELPRSNDQTKPTI